MKIFVINLKQSERRRRNIERQLSKLRLDYEVVEAVDGLIWGKEKMKGYISSELLNRLPSGHLACGLSHYFLYKRIVDENLLQALILEDDVLLSSEVPVILSYFDNNPLKESEIVLLHMQIMYGVTNLLTNHSIRTSINSKAFYLQPEGSVGSTAAYIATREFAKKKIENDFPISITVDGWKNMMRHNILDYIRCVYPYPVTPAMFPSDINYVDEHSLKFKIKKYANSLPLISTLLKKKRRKDWEDTQVNIKFSNKPLLSAGELFK